MNIISFDIEEWALAKAEGYGTPEKYKEYDDFLNRILDLLDSRNIKATFFCTGLMAKNFPQVVKLIQSRGHEIGCHSNRHTWMNKMTETECREDTHCAVDSLEQCIGGKVLSYRAPAFSIGESNKWAFEILAENGIERDASIFPAARDFGGFSNFGQKTPCIVEYGGIQLKEFPVCTTKVIGKEMAYSGGGYFRFFPLWFVKRQMARSDYAMCYFHIGDLVPEFGEVMTKKDYEAYFKEPGTLKNRYLRYIKSNLGKKGAFDKMMRLIAETEFVNLEEADKRMAWEKVPLIVF